MPTNPVDHGGMAAPAKTARLCPCTGGVAAVLAFLRHPPEQRLA